MRASHAAAFSLVVVVMLAHEAEHVAQVLQKRALGATCPNDCRGLLGFAFDVEWVHVAYNHSLLVALVAVYLAAGLWRAPWRERRPASWALLTASVFLVQGYHVIEHSVKLDQWFANGHRSPTPGILGMHVSLVELHFAINTAVFLGVLAGYVGLGFAHRTWQARTPSRVALAAGAVALAAVATGALWTQRPPTLRLAAGVHDGPLVVDRAQRIVGEPGTVVRGGIRITADDVVVRDVAVSGGENGIEVDGAEAVVLDGVRVAGALLDGINVRRSAVAIRDCRIDSRTRYAQGIDISFAFDLPASVVERCAVRGGQEGIVSHSAHVRVRENRVTGTTLRAITVTEMSTGEVRANEVTDALGVGIFCGDYSQCVVEGNAVRRTRPDRSRDDLTRRGYAIQAHFGARAQVSRNEVVASPGGVAAFTGGKVVHSG